MASTAIEWVKVTPRRKRRAKDSLLYLSDDSNELSDPTSDVFYRSSIDEVLESSFDQPRRSTDDKATILFGETTFSTPSANLRDLSPEREMMTANDTLLDSTTGTETVVSCPSTPTPLQSHISQHKTSKSPTTPLNKSCPSVQVCIRGFSNRIST